MSVIAVITRVDATLSGFMTTSDDHEKAPKSDGPFFLEGQPLAR